MRPIRWRGVEFPRCVSAYMLSGPLRGAGGATGERWGHGSARKALSTKCAGSAQVTGHPSVMCVGLEAHIPSRRFSCVEFRVWNALSREP